MIFEAAAIVGIAWLILTGKSGGKDPGFSIGGTKVGPGGEEPEQPGFAPLVPFSPEKDPKPRMYVKVWQGSNLTRIVQKAYGAKAGTQTVQAIHCVTAANLDLYGEVWDPGNAKFPKYTSVDVNGVPYVIAKAFRLENDDSAAMKLRAREAPVRGSGTSYGVLWLPGMILGPEGLSCEDTPPPVS